jgi:hypothetical protein
MHSIGRSGIITGSEIGRIETGQHSEFSTALESFFTSKFIGLVKEAIQNTLLAIGRGARFE